MSILVQAGDALSKVILLKTFWVFHKYFWGLLYARKASCIIPAKQTFADFGCVRLIHGNILKNLEVIWSCWEGIGDCRKSFRNLNKHLTATSFVCLFTLRSYFVQCNLDLIFAMRHFLILKIFCSLESYPGPSILPLHFACIANTSFFSSSPSQYLPSHCWMKWEYFKHSGNLMGLYKLIRSIFYISHYPRQLYCQNFTST